MKNPSKTYKDESLIPKKIELVRTTLKTLLGCVLVLFIQIILEQIILNQ